MKQPIYEIELKAIRCNVELWLNDILIYNHYEENGSVWIDWPINHFMLNSGIQNFEVRLFPYRNQKLLDENIQLEIGVHYYDKFNDLNRLDIIEKKSIEISNPYELPVYIYRNTFNANVPFELEGWKNSIDLKKENEKELLKELIQWNEKLLNVLKTSNLKEYNSIFKQKEMEYDKSNYTMYQENTIDVFHSKFKDLISLPNEIYNIVFYAKGNIVSVRIPYKLPGFTYDSKIKDENGMGVSLILYFHRKQKGMPLEIVR